MKTILNKPVKKNNHRVKNIFLSIACFILTGICTLNCNAITDALKIKIARNGYTDETVIRFISGATTGFDGSYDSWKMFSSNSLVPGIFSKTTAGENLSINAFPAFNASITKEVFLKIGVSGNYTITPSEIGAFAAGVKIVMKDLVTGQLYDLRNANSYSINLPVTAQTASARFQVLFSYPAQVVTADVSCTTCTDGTAGITKAGQTNWSYGVSDSTGTTVQTGVSSTSTYNVNSLIPGNYTVLITSDFSATETISFSIHASVITTLGAKFIDFAAAMENKAVKINWSTGVESNTDYFTVERSKDGMSYESINTIKASGNSSFTRSYTTYDENPYDGSSFYRIKLTDVDGTISYSKIVSIIFEGKVSFSVFPIPASDFLNVCIENSKDRETTIIIRDITGKNCFTEKTIPDSDHQRISIDISNKLLPGTYIITVIEKENALQQKIIVY